MAVLAIASGIAGLLTSPSGEDAGWFAIGVLTGVPIMVLES
jgi:hypothetical protein